MVGRVEPRKSEDKMCKLTIQALLIFALSTTVCSRPIDPKDLESKIQTKAWDTFEEIWNMNCGFGMFISTSTKTCLPCDKHCPNGKEIGRCGRECISYFEIKKLKAKNAKLNETVEVLNAGQEDLTGQIKELKRTTNNTEAAVRLNRILVSISIVVLGSVVLAVFICIISVKISSKARTRFTWFFCHFHTQPQDQANGGNQEVVRFVPCAGDAAAANQ